MEFLNEQMSNTEVIAIEIRRYVSEEEEMLVPRVIGATAAAAEAKARPPSRRWNEQTILAALRERDSIEAAMAEHIFQWARDQGLRFTFGTGADTAGFYPVCDAGGKHFWGIGLNTAGKVWIGLGDMEKTAPFDDPELISEFRRRIASLRGVDLSPAPRYPTFPLLEPADEGVRREFVAHADWALERFRETATFDG